MGKSFNKIFIDISNFYETKKGKDVQGLFGNNLNYGNIPTLKQASQVKMLEILTFRIFLSIFKSINLSDQENPKVSCASNFDINLINRTIHKYQQ